MRLQLKYERGNFFLSHWDLNHGPLELKASELPMSKADPMICPKLEFFRRGIAVLDISLWYFRCKMAREFSGFMGRLEKVITQEPIWGSLNLSIKEAVLGAFYKCFIESSFGAV